MWIERGDAFSRTARFLLALAALAAGVEGRAIAQEIPAQRDNAAPPALDDRGAPLPAGALARIGGTRLRHGDRVTALAFAPDGNVLASGSADRTVRLWDLATGKELAGRREHANAVTALAFAAGGQVLAAADADRAIFLWDPAGLTLLRRLPGLHQVGARRSPEGPEHIVVSRDGKTLITLGADVVVFWEAQSGKALRSVERSTAHFDCIALSPDDKLLAGGEFWGTLHLVDAATGKVTRTFKIAEDAKSAHRLVWTEFLPDGKHLLVADQNKEIHLVDVAGGKVVRRFEHHAGWPRQGTFALSPDGKTLVAADGHDDGGIGWYDVATGQRRRLDKTKPRPATFASLAFSRDGKRLAAGDVHGSIHLFDGVTGEQIQPFLEPQPRVTSVALAPDGKTIATASHDHTIQWWDAAGKEIGRIPWDREEIRELAFAPDGMLVLAGNEHLRFWDLRTREEVQRLPASYRWALARNGELFSATVWREAVEFSFWDATGKKLRTLPGHWPWHAAYSPDGKLIATAAGSPTNDVQLWDATTGKTRHRWPTRAVDERCVAFSPDGQWLALAGEQPTRRFGLRVWNTVTGIEDARDFGAGVRFRHVAYSPGGKILIGGSDDGLLHLWDTATGKELGRVAGHFNRITQLAFAADGKTLISGSRDGTALIWDFAELLRQAKKSEQVAAPATAPSRLDLHGDPLPDGTLARMGSVRWRREHSIGAVAISPDGSRLALGGSRYQKLRGVLHQETILTMLNVADGKEVFRFQGHDFFANLLAFSPDGTMVAAGSQEGLGLWDAATGKRVHRLGDVRPHPFHPDNLVFSPDGKTLVVDQFTQEKGKRNIIRRWDTATGKELPSLPGQEAPIDGLAFSADGQQLVSVGFETQETRAVCRWELATGKKLGEFSVPSRYVALAPNSTILAYHGADKKIHVLDAATQRERCTIDVEESAILFTPGGNMLATGGGNAIRLWDTATGKLIRQFQAHAGLITYLKKFSPNGKLLATVDGHSCGIRLWNVGDGQEIPTVAGHRDGVDALAYSPDGKVLASASQDLTIHLWNASTGQSLQRLTGNKADIRCLAFSPDGKMLASASRDQTTRLWDAVTGNTLASMSGPPGEALAVAFTPDGKLLLAVHADGTVRIWDVARRKEQRRFTCAENKIVQAAFSPDGKALATLDGDPQLGSYANRVRVWNVATGRELWTNHLGPVDRLQSQGTAGWTIAFSSDSKLLATSQSLESHAFRHSSSNHTIRFWEVFTGKEICKLDGLPVPCRFLAFAADGRGFAHGHGEMVARGPGAAQSVVFRDISAGVDMGMLVGGKAEPVCLGSGRELTPLAGHLGAVSCLAVSPDGKTIATGSADQTILIWDRGRFVPAKTAPAPDPSAKEMETLWADLADADAGRAYRAIGRLAAAPEQSVSLLKQRLQPAVAADPRRVKQLIADLDDHRFAVRQKATEELERIGDLAEPEVRQALADAKSLEHQRRLEQLLNKLGWFSVTPDYLRRQRALVLLERLGTGEARRVLAELAEGAPAARQTQAARAALGRLEGR